MALACPAWTKSPGSVGADFLKIEAAPIPASLAGAYTAAGGADSLPYNPAGISFVNDVTFSASHNEGVLGLRQEYASLVFPTAEAGALGLGGSFMYSGDIDAYDVNDAPIGKTQTQHGVAMAAYAFQQGLFAPPRKGRRVPPPPRVRVAFGVAPKVVYEKLDGVQATAFALDLGTLVDILGRVRLGFAVSNLGQKQKFLEEGFFLPVTVRAGAGVRLNDPTRTVHVTLLADAVKPLGDELRFAYGAKVEPVSWAELRAGWRANEDGGRSRWTAGAGLLLDRMMGVELFEGIRVDYAYLPEETLDTTTHRLGFQLKW